MNDNDRAEVRAIFAVMLDEALAGFAPYERRKAERLARQKQAEADALRQADYTRHRLRESGPQTAGEFDHAHGMTRDRPGFRESGLVILPDGATRRDVRGIHLAEPLFPRVSVPGGPEGALARLRWVRLRIAEVTRDEAALTAAGGYLALKWKFSFERYDFDPIHRPQGRGGPAWTRDPAELHRHLAALLTGLRAEEREVIALAPPGSAGVTEGATPTVEQMARAGAFATS